jgi:hypothetical protein
MSLLTVVEDGLKVPPSSAHRSDDDDGDECDHDAVFDGGCALLFVAETDHEVGVMRESILRLLSETDGWPCTSTNTKLASEFGLNPGSWNILRKGFHRCTFPVLLLGFPLRYVLGLK